jgi:hypothetical protein
MDQVDRLLDRLAAEIDHRDRLIAELTRPAGERFGEGVSSEPVARPDAAPGALPSAVPGGQEAAAATAPTATAEPGFGPGVAPAPDPAAAGQETAENPLSAWYRPDQQQ